MVRTVLLLNLSEDLLQQSGSLIFSCGVGDFLSNKKVVIIALIGLALGFLWGGSPIVALGIIAFAAGAAIVLSDYTAALCVLTGYGVIDYIFRNFAEAFASIWDEAFLCCLVLLWIYKWITCRKEDNFKTSPMDLPIIMFISAMLVVLFVNSSDFSIALEGFRAIVQYMLFYFVAIQLVKDVKSARIVVCVFVIIAGVMALHGVYQYIIGVEMPAGWVDQNEAGVRTRVYSILTSPNIFASMLTLSTPMAAALVFSSDNKKGKIIFGILALAMTASLVFTFSRGAWIGFAVAVLIYVLLKDKRLLIPCVVFGILVIFLVPSVGNRIGYMLSPEYIESSLRGGRLVRWLTGFRILEFYPVFGVGLGSFGGAVAMNHEATFLIDTEYIDTFYMDNYFLKTAVESGIFGLAAFIILMYCVVINSYRAIKTSVGKLDKELSIGIMAGLCGVITHNFVENVFEVPMMTSLFWVFVAVIMGIWYTNNPVKNEG